jgi:hypothetical protein
MEIPLFSIRKLYCNCCDHSCNDEESWKKHITNNNHVNRIGGDVKSIKIFWCKLCDVKCSGKYDWDRHINTNKHKGKIDNYINKEKETNINDEKTFKCEICYKEYKARTSLWYHKRSCNKKVEVKSENALVEKDELVDHCAAKNHKVASLSDEFGDLNAKDIIIDLLKQNKELQSQIIEISKESKVTNIYNNTNNTTNNQFNLNMFLNETCKNALNIDDFMDSIKLTIEDLETTGELGFVQGITRIFLKGLKDLDITKRPFHCTDVKRETVYIRDQDTWEKETTEKKKIRQALNQAVRKNLGLLPKWQQEHPDYLRSNTKDNDEYIKISLNSLGSEYKDEQQRMDEKIIKNVLKEIMLDRKNCIQE